MGLNPKLRSKLLAFSGAILLVCGVGYRIRFRIAAQLWHWRHGYIFRLATFDIPVPARWLPKQDIPDGLILYDTKAGAGIQIFLLPPLRDTAFWETKRVQKLQNDHVKTVVDHTLYIGDQKVVCVGGSEFQDELKIPAPRIISLDCQSTGPLHLMFVGQNSELETFYNIASRIKEHK